MGYGESDKQKPEEAHAVAILDTAMKARDSLATGDVDKFYAYTTVGIDLVSPVVDYQTRIRVNHDKATLTLEIKKIRDDRSLHEASKANMIRALKLSFAEAHLHLIFASMSRTDLFKPKAEGSIDFSVQDINKLASAIRREPLVKKDEKSDKQVEQIEIVKEVDQLTETLSDDDSDG